MPLKYPLAAWLLQCTNECRDQLLLRAVTSVFQHAGAQKDHVVDDLDHPQGPSRLSISAGKAGSWAYLAFGRLGAADLVGRPSNPFNIGGRWFCANRRED